VTRFRQAGGVLGLVVVFAGCLAGCNVNARLDITLRADGSGVLRSIVTLDADAVTRLGGAAALSQDVPLGDLRTAGWGISRWVRATNGSESITFTHAFVDPHDLARRIVDLAGPHGVLQNPTVTHKSGWFASSSAVSIVVDVRSPSVDIVHDAPLAARLRAAGVDPARLEAQLDVELRSALHLTVVVHLPGGKSQSYDAATGSVKTFRVAQGGTNWDHVVKFGIGVMLAVIAALFFLAATVGARRSRRRVVQRAERTRAPVG
jgi:hypothetical protein